MSEHIRSIEVTLKVDTNKRTMAYAVDADSLEAALDEFRELVADIRCSL